MDVVPNPIPSPAPVPHGMQVDDHSDGKVSTQVLAGDCNEVIMQTLDLLTMLYSNLQWQLLSRSLSLSVMHFCYESNIRVSFLPTGPSSSASVEWWTWEHHYRKLATALVPADGSRASAACCLS